MNVLRRSFGKSMLIHECLQQELRGGLPISPISFVNAKEMVLWHPSGEVVTQAYPKSLIDSLTTLGLMSTTSWCQPDRREVRR